MGQARRRPSAFRRDGLATMTLPTFALGAFESPRGTRSRNVMQLSVTVQTQVNMPRRG
jgi:hypothetical protein